MTITDPVSSDPNGVDFQYYTSEFSVSSTTNRNPITGIDTIGWTYDYISILNYSETANKISFTIPSTIPVAYIGIMGPAGNGGSYNDDGGGGGGWYTGVLPVTTDGDDLNLYLCTQTPSDAASPINYVSYSGNSVGYNCGAAGWGTNGKDAEGNSTGHAGNGGGGATNNQLYIDDGYGGTAISIQNVNTWLFNGGGGGGGGSANVNDGIGSGSGGTGGTSQSFQSNISGVNGTNGKGGSSTGGNGGYAGTTTYSCYDNTSCTTQQTSNAAGCGGSGDTISESGDNNNGNMGPIPYAMIYYLTPSS